MTVKLLVVKPATTSAALAVGVAIAETVPPNAIALAFSVAFTILFTAIVLKVTAVDVMVKFQSVALLIPDQALPAVSVMAPLGISMWYAWVSVRSAEGFIVSAVPLIVTALLVTSIKVLGPEVSSTKTMLPVPFAMFSANVNTKLPAGNTLAPSAGRRLETVGATVSTVMASCVAAVLLLPAASVNLLALTSTVAPVVLLAVGVKLAV